VANAQTEAEQLRRKAVIDTGDTGIASELKFDPNTLSAAGQNPESIRAQIAREFAQKQKDLEEAFQSQNLFYSGAYADELGKLGQGRASAEASVGQRLRDLLAGIDSGVLESQETARQAELDAQLNEALMSKYYGGSTTAGRMGGTSGRLAYTSGAAEKLAGLGFSDESVYSAISSYAAQRGWTPYLENGVPGTYGIQHNGEYVTGPDGQIYVWVKVGTPTGNSTELIPIGNAPGAQTTQTVTAPVLTPDQQQLASSTVTGGIDRTGVYSSPTTLPATDDPLTYYLTGGGSSYGPV